MIGTPLDDSFFSCITPEEAAKRARAEAMHALEVLAILAKSKAKQPKKHKLPLRKGA